MLGETLSNPIEVPHWHTSIRTHSHNLSLIRAPRDTSNRGRVTQAGRQQTIVLQICEHVCVSKKTREREREKKNRDPIFSVACQCRRWLRTDRTQTTNRLKSYKNLATSLQAHDNQCPNAANVCMYVCEWVSGKENMNRTHTKQQFSHPPTHKESQTHCPSVAQNR